MSSMQSLGLQVSGLSRTSEAMASKLFCAADGLRQSMEIIRQAMKGTAQGENQALLAQLSAAQKQLTAAAQYLAAAAAAGRHWLAGHIGTGDTALPGRLSEAAEQGEAAAILEALENQKIAYRAIEPAERTRSTEEIVARLGGGDKTRGSCSSLAFAYIGNIAGYDVLDFRDGDSRSFFSKDASIEQIANLPGVRTLIYRGKDELICANDLLKTLQPGKAYYLATGLHASIVRMIDGHYEYLELQHPTRSGWHVLNDMVLLKRFGCSRDNPIVCPNFLIEADSLAQSQAFLTILGYLNTAAPEQHKGENGSVR